jgi:hypothetical protein
MGQNQQGNQGQMGQNQQGGNSFQQQGGNVQNQQPVNNTGGQPANTGGIPNDPWADSSNGNQPFNNGQGDFNDDIPF